MSAAPESDALGVRVTPNDQIRARGLFETRVVSNQARFREAMSHFASGISIVTALEEGVPVGFTCQAFTALSLEPPMVALAPAKTSTSWPRIARAGAFCVNVLSSRQEEVCRTFAVSGADKFDGVGWCKGITGSPVLDGCLAWVECRVGVIHDAGDHELVTGRVVDLGTNDGDPLIFFRSGFGTFVG